MERININGKYYQAKEIDFNFICNLEVEGVEFAKMGKNFMTMLKVYVAYCMDADTEVAGDEINQHIINGGDLSEIIETLQKKLEESDFFQALSKKTEQASQETPKKDGAKKEVGA